MVNETRPASLDVTRRNRSGAIYIKGDADTDKSQRMVFEDAVDPLTRGHRDIIHFERRDGGIGGVWKDTSILVNASGSLQLGPDMHLEAAADFLKTLNPSGQAPHGVALIPHTPFINTDPGSGTLFAHSPVCGPLIIEEFVTGESSEIIADVIGQFYDINIPQIIKNITFKTGSVAPIAPVFMGIFKGTNNTGSVIHTEEFKASDFPVNGDFVVDFNSDIGFSNLHPVIFIEFLSTNNLSLKTDVNDMVLMTAEAQELQVRDVIYDDMALGLDLSLIFANDLSIVFRNQFPQIAPEP